MTDVRKSFDIYGPSDDVVPGKVRSLLVSDPQVLFERDKLGNTLLHEAVLSHDPQLVTDLLALGADPNAQGLGQQTPLHIWSQDLTGPISVGELLLQRGGNPNARDYRGFSPLAAVARTARNLKKQVVELLLHFQAILDINSALRLGRFDYVRQLLTEQPDVIRSAPNDLVPFPADLVNDACFVNANDMVPLLMSSGADKWTTIVELKS